MLRNAWKGEVEKVDDGKLDAAQHAIPDHEISKPIVVVTPPQLHSELPDTLQLSDASNNPLLSVPETAPSLSDTTIFASQNDDAIIEPSIATVIATMALSSQAGDRGTMYSSRDVYAKNIDLTFGDDTGYDDPGCSSMVTLASSINTEHQHTQILGFGYENPHEQPVPRAPATSEKRKSLGARSRSRPNSIGGKSVTKAKARKSLALANPPDEDLLRSLPDPSTFPIPYPIKDTGVSGMSTYGRQKQPGSDVLTFARPAPLPKLKLVTNFSNPASSSATMSQTQAPLSAISSMSNFQFASATRPNHARNMSSAASIRSVSSGIGSGPSGKRPMNRLTLTDPRSPMPSARVAAATLVARVKQKREAMARKKASKQHGPPPSAFFSAFRRGQRTGEPKESNDSDADDGLDYVDADVVYSASDEPNFDGAVSKGTSRHGGSGFFG